jgi:hypothetical protein
MIPDESPYVHPPRRVRNPWTPTAAACSLARATTLHYPLAIRAKTRPTATNGGPRVIDRNAPGSPQTSRGLNPSAYQGRAQVR